MKITGFEIREALRNWQLRKATVDGAFPDSAHKFEGEDKTSPIELLDELQLCEEAIAELEEIQTKYNLLAKVSLGNKAVTLCYLVKAVGGAGRIEKMWRGLVTGGKRDSYNSAYELRKEKNTEIAKQNFDLGAAKKGALAAAKRAGAVRTALALGNTVVVELEIDPRLFA